MWRERFARFAFALLMIAWCGSTATAQDSATILAELGGVEWHWQATRDAQGRVLITPPTGAYRMVFVRGSVADQTPGTGTTLSILTPCNNAHLEAAFREGKFSLGATGVGSTLMWCGDGAFGPHGDALIEDLQSVVAYRVDGSTLVFTTERDTRALEFGMDGSTLTITTERETRVLEFVQRPLAPRDGPQQTR
jgi:hypothetical protein